VSAGPKAKGQRPPERDYSHRSLLDKLGVKAGQAIAVLGLEDQRFFNELAARVPDFSRDSVVDGAEKVLFRAENADDLSYLKQLVKKIHKDGAIWVIYPKGQSHIREVDVIAPGKAAGLVDNKVCRFSDTHAALRFVIPLAQR
jgi:hypothetical protein